MNTNSFESKLIKNNQAGAWTFTVVPKQFEPTSTEAWGRAPVHATVDGKHWKTSVWKGRDGLTYLPIPKKIRGKKQSGDSVTIKISYLNETANDLRSQI